MTHTTRRAVVKKISAAFGEGGDAAGWDAGLPPPARRQAPCPAGTVAVPALGRTDALRCLPH